jgi:hypothetical protein
MGRRPEHPNQGQWPSFMIVGAATRHDASFPARKGCEGGSGNDLSQRLAAQGLREKKIVSLARKRSVMPRRGTHDS